MPDLRLRAPTDADLDILYAYQQDPQSYQMAAFPPRDREAFRTHWDKIRADETAIAQVIELDGEVAGDIGSWEADGRREVGYWVGRAYWGRGIATAALRLVLERTPTRPLYAHVAVGNAGSIRVLEKCGFRRQGGPETAEDGVELYLMMLR
jgi:RimJ/RimL family protein N-acetyltransferase